MKLNKETMETKKTQKTTNNYFIVVGWDIEQMKKSVGIGIPQVEAPFSLGTSVKPLFVLWERGGQELLEDYDSILLPTPNQQGMDCLNYAVTAVNAGLDWVNKKKGIITGICNTHTITKYYDAPSITYKKWKEIWNIEMNTKRYVDDIIQERLKEFNGTEDTNI